MDLLEENNIKHQYFCHGMEVKLKIVPDVTESFTVYNGGATVENNVTMLLHLDERKDECKSQILYLNDAPELTKRTTAELIKEYAKKNCVNQRVLKYFCKELFDKGCYKLPYISPEACFVPIEGDSIKSVTYFNLALLNTIYRKGRDNCVVRMCNGTEIELLAKYSLVKELIDIKLVIYASYYSCENIYEVDIFSKWEGSYYLKRKDYIEREAKTAMGKGAKEIKIKAMFKIHSTKEDRQEIIDDEFNS